ncbi:MAG: hypothetical protein ACM3Y9_07740 [Ignavibacteria bacterium]
MQVTTYYVTRKTMKFEPEAQALVDLINDTSCGNGDNHSWNAMRAQLDASIDRDTQQRLGIAVVAEQSEAEED